MSRFTSNAPILAAAVAGVLVFAGNESQAATVTWSGAGDGVNWTDDANWSGTGFQPTADDIAVVGTGNSVQVNGSANYGSFTTGAGSIAINSGGTLTASGNTGTSNTIVRYISEIAVNDGGTFNVTYNTVLRGNVTVNSGGVFNGAGSMRNETRTLSVSGLWRVSDNSNGANVFLVNNGSTVSLNTGGTIELDLFANNVNESFSLENAAGTIDLADGTINLVPQGGYTPAEGDTFDLFNVTAGTFNPGDGSNVTLAGYTLDTSAYASTGVVTVVPESASLGLLAMGGLGLMRRRLS